MDIWIAPRFGRSYSHQSFCGNMLLFLFGKCLGVELLDHREDVWLCKDMPESLHPGHATCVPTATFESPPPPTPCSTSSPALAVLCLFNFNHSCGCVTTVSHCGFKIAFSGVLGVNASSLGLYLSENVFIYTHTHTHTPCFKNRVFSLDIEISVDKLFPNSYQVLQSLAQYLCSPSPG